VGSPLSAFSIGNYQLLMLTNPHSLYGMPSKTYDLSVKGPLLKHERQYAFNQIYEIPTGSVIVGGRFQFYYGAFKPKGIISLPNAGVNPKKN